jgi:hypothetical protein
MFEPLLEPEPGDDNVEILYAISPTTPSGAGGSLLLDGSVMMGFDSMQTLAFPSLEHFLECEALLWAVGDRHPANPDPADLESLSLDLLTTASGAAVQWWSNGSELVYIDQIWAKALGHRPRAAKQWAIDAALRAEIAEHLTGV